MTLDGVEMTGVEHYCNKFAKFARDLRTFGEACTVTTGKVGKVGDHGATMILWGMLIITPVIATECLTP